MALDTLLALLFPTGTISYIDERRGSFEINGLDATATPQACEIIGQGNDRYAARGERREHFFVQIQGHLLFFRICSASPGSGYAAFATGRGGAVPVTDNERAAEMHDYAQRTLANLCD